MEADFKHAILEADDLKVTTEIGMTISEEIDIAMIDSSIKDLEAIDSHNLLEKRKKQFAEHLACSDSGRSSQRRCRERGDG